MTTDRTPKQQVAKWARDVLGEESRTSPRCPRYPECGGEDGSGALLHGEGLEEMESARFDWSSDGGKSLRAKMRKRREAAPRCRECAKYAKAVEALLDKLDAASRSKGAP